MKIVILQPWIRVGGAELLSLELAAGLERAGHQARIATLFVEAAGLPERLVGGARFALPPEWLRRRFAASRALTYALGPLALLALTLRAARGADLLNPHNLPAPLVAALAGRLRGLPVVWTLNEVPEALSDDEARTLGTFERAAWHVGSALASRLAHVPAAILVLSEKTRRDVRARYGRDATVAMPGVSYAANGARPRSRDGPTDLLFVGKLHPQKNPALAVRTLACLLRDGVDARLTLVGDGPLRGELERLGRDLGVERAVRWRARLSHDELRDEYASATVVLVTGIGHQSWGLTPFEALAVGTPSVVSSQVGGGEVLAARNAALVVAPEPESFAGAAARLARDGALAATLVENGRSLLSGLTWDRYAERCASVFAGATGTAREDFDYEKKVWGAPDVSTSPTQLGALRLREALRALDGVPGPLLEVGCGGGGFARAFARDRTDLVLGVDVSAAALREAARRGGARYLRADAMRLPLADGSVGAVTFFDVLEHVDDPLRLLRECRRVLRADGVLHAYVPVEGNRHTLHGLARLCGFVPKRRYAGHVQQLTDADLRRLLAESGFAIAAWTYSGHLVNQVFDVAYFTALALARRNTPASLEAIAERSRSPLARVLGAAVAGVALASYVESCALARVPGSGVHLTARAC